LFRRAALDYIVSHPVETVLRIPLKLFYYFRDEVSGWQHYGSVRSPVIFAGMALAQVVYMAVTALAIYGMIDAHLKKRGQVDIMPLLLIASFIVVAMIFLGAGRYRLPSVPFYTMYAAYALSGRFAPVATTRLPQTA
jgi:hypothetical protein